MNILNLIADCINSQNVALAMPDYERLSQVYYHYTGSSMPVGALSAMIECRYSEMSVNYKELLQCLDNSL